VEREEFAGFYAASFQRLVCQLYAMIGDQSEAQDVVQEAFVRAWARRSVVLRGQVRGDEVTPRRRFGQHLRRRLAIGREIARAANEMVIDHRRMRPAAIDLRGKFGHSCASRLFSSQARIV
jgi:hypothetical protein